MSASVTVTHLSSGCLLYRHSGFCAANKQKRVGNSAAPPKTAKSVTFDGAGPTMRFGQYKGRLLSDIVADRNYVSWLLSQSWFAEKFPEHRHYLEAIHNNMGPSAA